MHATDSALPLLAILALLDTFPGHEDTSRRRDALRLHIDDYVFPMTARSAYRIMPYGAFIGSPSPDTSVPWRAS